MNQPRGNLRGIMLLAGLAALFVTTEAQAVRVQILHTNDLHAAIETFGAPGTGQAEYGGWAQLKKTMDSLTLEAAKQGIETLRLDAGDFTEGTSYYFPGHGAGILRAFQHLNYDAVALGNHDWLMGAEDLNALYRAIPFPFPVLSANVRIDPRLEALKKQIVPSTQITRGGVKFGIFGLSTDEILYSWIPRVNSRKNDLRIDDYRDAYFNDDGESGTRMQMGLANQIIAGLKKDNDVVIGLTHIGFEEDKKLAFGTRGIDLIVGGHSHTFLDKAVTIKDQAKRAVPIVQAGYNGKFVGRIFMDVNPGQPPKLVSYELIPIIRDLQGDPLIESDVHAVSDARDEQFGARMREVVGYSEDRLVSGDGGPTSFSKFAVDAIRDVISADIAIDVGAFHGNTPQTSGNVTRLKLMEMYPRKFELNHNEGLYVYQAKIPGLLLKAGLNYAIRFGTYVGLSGVSYDLKKMSDAKFAELKARYAGTADEAVITPYYPENIAVGGTPLRSFHWYKLAAPESLIRGAYSISSLTHLLIRDGHSTPHTVWDAMNYYLLKKGSIRKINPPSGPSPWSPEIRTPRYLVFDLVTAALKELLQAPLDEPDSAK